MYYFYAWVVIAVSLLIIMVLLRYKTIKFINNEKRLHIFYCIVIYAVIMCFTSLYSHTTLEKKIILHNIARVRPDSTVIIFYNNNKRYFSAINTDKVIPVSSIDSMKIYGIYIVNLFGQANLSSIRAVVTYDGKVTNSELEFERK